MKRLIDADEIEELFYKQVEYGATDLMDAFDDALQDAQTVDAIAMPAGKPGDIVVWDNGVEPQLFLIYGIYIDRDSVRYDLGSFCPVVDHKNIVRITPFDGTPPDGTKTLKVKFPDESIGGGRNNAAD